MTRPSHAGASVSRLPRWYLGFAHLSMLTAAVVVALDPRSVTGFYYHPLMIGVVHLVTLGWISSSIIGALFIVGPLTMQMRLPVGRLDYVAFASYAIGVVGMVSHFWIREYSGMAWSAAMVVAGVAQVGTRVARSVLTAPLPAVVRGHVVLAGVNLVVAGGLGMLIGADRETDVVPGSTLANVYAHAHLAGIGWATLMVAGLGFGLWPSMRSSALRHGRRLALSLGLFQVGVAGLFLSLLTRGATSLLPGLVTVTGIGVFATTVASMRGDRRPAPPEGPMPDWGRWHTAAALAYLAVTVGCGLVLAGGPPTTWSTRLAAAYGVCGLLGFLSQIVVGLGSRLPASNPGTGRLTFGGAVFCLWSVAVPALAAGLALERAVLVGLGGWCLLGAAMLHTLDTHRALRHRR